MAEGYNLAKAYVQIMPSAEGIKGKITEALGGEAQQAGESAGGKIVSAIKRVIAAAGIGAALKSAISEGADLQQSIGGIETLFGTNGAKSVQEYADMVGQSVEEVSGKYALLEEAQRLALSNADQAYKTAGLSANDYMQTVTGFAAALKSSTENEYEAAKAADQAVIDMADNANKMGTDMSAIQNAYQGFAKQNYTMLDNLKLGYGGTKTEMERLLKDATALSGVEYDIDSLSDVYSAIHVIQDQLGITGTTAREASETISGSLASMKASWSNFLGKLTLGEDLGPSLSALAESVVTFGMDNLLPAVGNIITALPGAAFTFIQEIIPRIKEHGAQLMDGFRTGLSESLSEENLHAVFDVIDAIFIDSIPSFTEDGLKLIESFGVGVLDALPGFSEAIYRVIDVALEDIVNSLPEILDAGVDMISSLANGILENAPEVILNIGNILRSVMTALLAAAPTILAHGITLISNLAQGLLNNLPAILEAIGKVLAQLAVSILAFAPRILQEGIQLIANLVAGLIQAIPKIVAAVPQIISSFCNSFSGYDWGSLGRNLIQGIASGIWSGVGSIIDAARSVASQALNAAKSFLGIASPSKVAEREIGPFIPLGIAEGIRKNLGPISDAMQEAKDMVSGPVSADIRIAARRNEEMAGESSFAGGAKVYRGGAVTINVQSDKDPKSIAEYVIELLDAQYRKEAEAFA